VRQEAQALIEAGYEVTVVSPTSLRAPEREVTLDGVRVLRFESPPLGRGVIGYLREYALALWRMSQVLRRLRREAPFSAVISCNPPDFLIQLARPLARRGSGLVFDYHDPSPELFEAIFGRREAFYRLLLALERLAFRTADVVMTVNDACADLVRGRGGVPTSRVFVVRNCPDPRRFFPVEPRPELRRGREHLIVWVGKISRKEGLEYLVEAADELVNRRGRTDIAFVIVGPGDVANELPAQIERRALGDAIVLPGRADDELLREYLATADVCVSLDERNPMNDRSLMVKVLEYMAMGCAVVQFPLAEMRQVCGDTTVYANDGDALDLADRIEELVNDPARRAALGAAARERVLAGLMWPDQVPTLLEAVELAIGTGRRARAWLAFTAA
jgi:glycosyltransferase involved in cell wall biosynthesis